MSSPIKQLVSMGQSIWYDNIERPLLNNGDLAAMIQRGDIQGLTSNPTIFNNAIANSSDYDADLLPLAQAGKSPLEIFEALAVDDIWAAADLLRPLERNDKLFLYVALDRGKANLAMARHELKSFEKSLDFS